MTSIPRPVLIVAGAPRMPVDAVRHLTVPATGTTAVALRQRLPELAVDLLLSLDAQPGLDGVTRYGSRADLERELACWIAAHPEGVVVMSAAVNDYRVVAVERRDGEVVTTLPPGTKLPSRADEVCIRLRPDSKLIDRLRPDFGLRGPIVGFKFEDAATVLASAAELCSRVGCAVVVANSLCGRVQALVECAKRKDFTERDHMLTALAARLAVLARS
jgi:phosphopantothenoylcysteine synthetase/decarboxylase